MPRSKAIMHIIKRYNGKRLKKEHRMENTRYEFPTQSAATQACWAIHGDTGRECAAWGKILTMYT